MSPGGGIRRRGALVHAATFGLLWAVTLAVALARAPLLSRVVPESPHRGGYLLFVVLLAPLVLVLSTLLGLLIEARGRRASTDLARLLEAISTSLLLPFGLAPLVVDDPLRLGTTQGALFLIMLLLRVAGLVVQGRTSLGEDPRPAPGLVRAVTLGIPLAAYLGLFAWVGTTSSTTGDEPYYLLVARSLLRDGDTLLDNQMVPTSFGGFYWRDRLAPQNMIQTPEGLRSHAYTTLFPILLAPTGVLGARAGPTLLVMLLTAILAWRVFELGRRAVADNGAALFAWAVSSLTLPVLSFSSQIYPETVAALLGVVMLGEISGGSTGRPAIVRATLAAVLLPLLKIRYLPIALGGAVVAAWRSGKARRALFVLGGAAAAMAILLLIDRYLLGGVLVLSRFPEAGLVFRPRKLIRLGPAGLAGLLADREFGLLTWSPLWAVAPAGAWWALRRRGWGALAPLVPAVAYLAVLLGHFGHLWYGGFSQPGRYVVAVLPLLAPFLAWCWKEGRGPVLYGLTIIGTVWSVMVTVPYFLVPAFRYNAADTTSNLLSFVGGRLGVPLNDLFPSFVNSGAWGARGLSLALAALLVPSLLVVLGARHGAGTDVAPTTAGVVALAMIVAAVGLGWQLGRPTSLLEVEALPQQGGKLYTGLARGPARVFDGPGVIVAEYLSRGPRTALTVTAGARGADSPHLDLEVDGRPAGRLFLKTSPDRYQRGDYRFEIVASPGRHFLKLTIGAPSPGRATVYLDRLRFE